MMLVLPACGGEEQAAPVEEPAQPEPETETEPEAPTPEPTAEAGPTAEEDTFLVEARAEEGGYASGTLGQFAIHLAGRGEWHLNEEFPLSVEIEAPEGVSVPKTTLAKEDAAEFGEESARFDVPFTPTAAGEHRVMARVNFAVCNPQSCIPKSATLALNLPTS
ncbi:MAG: hypothetical protein AAGE52_39510 [Myxococcota bacterium]